MRTDSWKTALAWLLKISLGALFAYAGAMKLVDPSAFANEIANYRLFEASAPYVGAMLPGVEIVLGLALACAPRRSVWLSGAAIATASLCGVFFVAVTQVVLRGIDTRCGCFGGGSSSVSWVTVVRVGFLALSAMGLHRLARV